MMPNVNFAHRKLSKVIKFTAYLLLPVLLYSCKDEYTICDLSTVVRMKCGFYKDAAGAAAETSAPSLKVTRIPTVYPDYDLRDVSAFTLALNPIADSVQYRVSVIESSVPDTVTFVYTSEKITLSAVCGDIYVHQLTRVTTTLNTLDSVKISNGTINTTSGENVRIYF